MPTRRATGRTRRTTSRIVYGPRSTIVIAFLAEAVTDFDALYEAMSQAARNVYDLANDPSFGSSATPPLPPAKVGSYASPARPPTGAASQPSTTGQPRPAAPAVPTVIVVPTPARPDPAGPGRHGPARAPQPTATQPAIPAPAAPAPALAPAAQPKPALKPAEKPQQPPANAPAAEPLSSRKRRRSSPRPPQRRRNQGRVAEQLHAPNFEPRPQSSWSGVDVDRGADGGPVPEPERVVVVHAQAAVAAGVAPVRRPVVVVNRVRRPR